MLIRRQRSFHNIASHEVRVGQKVLVKSDDAVSHNVNADPLRNQRVNLLVGLNNRVGLELVYSEWERIPFAVKCDVHTWMKAYHLVLDHPFMAITDSEGKFEIKDLPVGKHKFRIWHERAEILERSYEVEIKADETTKVSLSYSEDKFNLVGIPYTNTETNSSQLRFTTGE